MFKKDVLIYFLAALILTLPDTISLYPYNYRGNFNYILSLIIQFNIPTFIMAIMNLIIEKQKSEKNIKILRKIKRILNVLSIIYLTLYEIFLLLIILFVKLWKLEPGGLLGE